jgi:hypothetical protein
MKRHNPIPVHLTEDDVRALDAFPFSRHSILVAAVRAGLALLAGNPERVLQYNRTVTMKRARPAKLEE